MTTFRDDEITFENSVTFEGDVTFAGSEPTFADVTATTIGDGTGSPALTLNKVATGTGRIELKNASALRGRVELDASEDLALSMFDTDGVTLLGKITINNATGAITLSKGTTITTGGLTVSSGTSALQATTCTTLTASAGFELTAGIAKLPLTDYADNAAALLGGLVAGNLYRTGGAVMVVT